MRLAVKVAYNTLAQLSGKIVGTVLGLATVGVMTRYLGQQGFGEYTTIITFASIFAIIADLGLTLVSTQLLNRNGAKVDEAVGNLLGFRLMSAVLIIGLAPAVIWFFPYSSIIKSGVVIASWAYLFFSCNQIFVSLLQKELKTQLVAITEVSSRLLLLGAVVAAAWLDWGLDGILFGMIASNVLTVIMYYIFCRKLAKIRLKFDWSFWKEIISRSWPMLTTIVLNLIYLKADIFILSLIRTQSEVGIYGVAYKVVDVVVTLPFLFAGLVLPILVKHWSAGDKDKFKFVAQKVFDVNVLAAWPLLIGGWLLAKPAIVLVAGKDFAVSGDILKILLPAIAVVFFSCFFTHIIISMEAQKKLIKFYLITALTAVPMYFYLINRFSYWGAAWGTVYSETLILIFAVIATRQETVWLPKLKMMITALAASAIMVLAIVAVGSLVNVYSVWGFCLVFAMAVLSYAFGLWKLGVLKMEKWQEFLETKK
jgi:O-antigen/teichoic acid export membrane protein